MSAARKIVHGAALLLLAVLAVSAGATFLEAGVCWEAFFRCIDDPFIKAWPIGSGQVYCLNGLLFCLKYIDGVEV
ncbi:MAG: hypothetical protein JW843_05490 [Candidatus Aminicenantes bacterium]|nr:hypothetical protein [Candidatus Aminicenantes bacterium]